MSRNSISFLASYFLIIPEITAVPPPSSPFRRLQFKRPNAPDAPDRSPSTTIVCISASIQIKEEGDLHMEDRGGMMMSFSIGYRGVK